jgi:GH24 family phage-related lysozyme (muramidase)
MIPHTSRRALEKLEKSVLEACGDRSLARRVRRDAEKGSLSGGQALRNLQKAVAKRCGNQRSARDFCAALEKQVQLAVPQREPTKLAVNTLIAKKVIGWAEEPGTKLAVLVTAGDGCLVIGADGKRITDRSIQFPNKFPAPVNKSDFETHARDPKNGEDVIDHMYRDTTGHVTIGIGHQISDETAARNLGIANFFFPPGSARQNVIEQDLADDFHAVLKAPPGNAQSFAKVAKIRITQGAITSLFNTDVPTKLREITATRQFSEYSKYPPEAKLGLLDMAYTLGVTKILKPATDRGYPKFTAAVQHRDWAVAAQESDRPDVNVHRNKQVFDWFQQAAKRERFFIRAPSMPKCQIKLATLLGQPI